MEPGCPGGRNVLRPIATPSGPFHHANDSPVAVLWTCDGCHEPIHDRTLRGRRQAAGQSRRGGRRVRLAVRDRNPPAGNHAQPGLVESQHLGQGRRLCRQGRGPKQVRRGAGQRRAVRRAQGSSRKPSVKDPLLARQIDVLYRIYLEKQVDPELLKRITSKANEIEQAFNVYRAKLNGKEITDSEVRRILKESKDSAERASRVGIEQGRGRRGEPTICGSSWPIATKRPTKLGFKDFHAMRLYLAEQDQAQVLALFDELDELTREPFAQAKAEIDVSAGRLLRHRGRRTAALALPGSVLPGSAGHFGRQPRQGLCQRRHPGHLPQVLRRHRPADRRRDRAQRPVRAARQEPARLLHRHRPRGRRARAGQHRAQRILDGHDAARAGPLGLQQQEHSPHACPTCCAPTPTSSAPRAWP